MLVHAEPQKEFFVEMLTRDITVVDCLMDLVDNAVDKEVSRTGLDVMQLLTNGQSGLAKVSGKISLIIGEDSITIEDTCGGIGIEEVKNKVFLLGNPQVRAARAGLSIYGIGMKRAFFKLGKLIDMSSRTETEEFSITIDVDAWLQQPSWNLELKSANRIGWQDEKSLPGTRIHIFQLRPAVQELLATPAFRNELRNRLSAGYGLFLRSGLQISVNDEQAVFDLPQLVAGDVQSVRRLTKYEDVDILIVAGLSPKADRTPHGWYVFCNGRMVAEADKTELTGWGTVLPEFRSKFNHFLGFIYFRSDEVWSLPWTTTKQGIFQEAPVYQFALREMRDHATPVLNFLNSLYRDDVAPDDIILERAVLAGAEKVDVDQVARTDSAFAVKTEPRSPSKDVNIQYKRSREVVDRIRDHLKSPGMAATAVGQHTFDYFVKQELE